MCDLLSETNSQMILSKLRDLSDISNVVFIDIFNDIFDLCGYPFDFHLNWLVSFMWTVDGVKQVNTQLNPARRMILKGLYEYYKKEHKFHGQS